MTLANSTLDQPDLAESISVPRLTESAHLNQLVAQIDTPKVREIVGAVFADLVRLLGCLRPVESQLDRIEEAEESFALFQFVHDEACALVKFIREDALTSKALTKELCDTLDGITFAVSHDLQRVFDHKLPEATDEATGRVVIGKLFRAHDVLTNCLQQATISLATTFDPELVGTKLFSQSDMCYRQSVQLCGDLSTLLELVEVCNENRDERSFATLRAGIERFRNEGMESLRYSDCPQFESFCESVQLATDQEELEPVLHQFRCYVETLLGQVRMRAVLASDFPLDVGEDSDEQPPSSAESGSPLFDSLADFLDDGVTQDEPTLVGSPGA